MADWYGGAWFFTGNSKYFPGGSTRTQKPIGSIEGHLGYYLKPRLWVSFDGNFCAGGKSTINDGERQDRQKNSRIGGTVSIPVNMHQSLKLSYSDGAYVSVGGDYRTISVAWQYSWLSVGR